MNRLNIFLTWSYLSQKFDVLSPLCTITVRDSGKWFRGMFRAIWSRLVYVCCEVFLGPIHRVLRLALGIWEENHQA